MVRVGRWSSGRGAPDDPELMSSALFFLRVELDRGGPAADLLASRIAAALAGRKELAFLSHAPAMSPAQRRLLEEELQYAFRTGAVQVELLKREVVTMPARQLEIVSSPPPPEEESNDTFYEVRFVDEIGEGVGNFTIDFNLKGETRQVRVSSAGIALLENVSPTSATIETPDPAAIERALQPRWTKRRPGQLRAEGNTKEFVFRGQKIGPIDVKPVVPNRIVLKPPLGSIFMELRDKTGKIPHRERKYTLSGPESFEGTTDANGRLRHPSVFPGDYRLKLTLDFFEGEDKQTDVYESPTIVLPPDAAEPVIRLIGAVPSAVLARLHFFFNRNKAFVLPTAIGRFAELRRLYLAHSPGKLLVVGHADTAGDAAFNDALSLDRAKSVIAFLKDDVDAWLAFYGDGIPQKKRWGSAEDRLMLVALPDFRTKPRKEDPVRWFQRTRKLQVDGIAGPETRAQLVTEYMSLDGASLADAGTELEATVHGCGEHFPLAEEGEAMVDAASKDSKRDRSNRRVELFFFDPEFGIVPTPPGDSSKAGSSEYRKWRKRAVELHEFEPGEALGPKVTFVELMDAHFRTDSAVVLPEGEAPGAGEQGALTSVGVFATALRFNDEQPGKRMFVAGHADTTGADQHNDVLSGERARCALALLVGDRDAFTTICDARHQVSDYKQILTWVSEAFDDVPFDCAPAKVDDNAASGVEPVRRFQKAYNENKKALGATGPDLAADGDVGPLTWGAFFDCYEFALREELGEDEDGVKALRARLMFVDDERKALGFGEHFPVEELGTDKYRSQANRRVEVLFFDPGEEPDLAAAEEDPETAELYLPGFYARTALAPMKTARRERYVLRLHLQEEEHLESTTRFVVQSGDQGFSQELESRVAATGEGGFVELTFRVPPTGTFTLRMFRENATPIVVFAGVPFQLLVGPVAGSAFQESPGEEPLGSVETRELREVYANSGDLL